MKVTRRFIIELEINECEENESFELIRQDIEAELSCCWHSWDKIEVKEIEQRKWQQRNEAEVKKE